MLVLSDGVGHVHHNTIRRCTLAPIVLAASARTVVADNRIEPGPNEVSPLAPPLSLYLSPLPH